MPTENYTFMFYGFTVAWLVIVVYVISIALREKKLREELERVKRMVGEGEREVKK
jgi:CcmD family protein